MGRKTKKSKANAPSKPLPAATELSTTSSNKGTMSNNQINRLLRATAPKQGGKSGISSVTGRSIAGKIRNMMLSEEEIAPDAKAFLYTSMNPCGERTGMTDGRPVDGALPNSASWQLRSAEIVIPPWASESILADTTRNWGLFIISPPAIKTACICIASKTNQQPPPSKMALIWNFYNTKVPATYPDWDDIDGEYYLTTFTYSGIDLDFDSNSGSSRTFQAGRMYGDGIVLFHNCPTLWDQGMLVGAQFPTNAHQVSTTSQALSTAIIAVAEASVGSPPSIAEPTKITILLPDENGNQYEAVSVTVTSPSSVNTPGFTPKVTGSLRYQGTVIATLTAGVTAQVTFIVENNGNVRLVSGVGPVFQVGGKGIETIIPTVFVATSLDISKTRLMDVWEAPDFSPKNLAQVDPRFDFETMKGHAGIYMVRHWGQPLMNVLDFNKIGNVKALSLGMDRDLAIAQTGGVEDILDLNANTYVICVRGLSYAAQPALKLVRFVEASVVPGSGYAVMMRPAPESCETSMEMWHQFNVMMPHSYPPDMNFLGGLFAVITSALQAIPVVMRTTRSIGRAVVEAVDWAEKNVLPTVEMVLGKPSGSM
uniref:Capsid protein n=1 Tax=Sichuan mosquito tombus-like virus TaxID=2864009 RepID=A0A8K1HHJ4_9TOMB|nr:hypothetical protein 4 [Sichuan mosquito tombus-like virus]